MVIIISSFLFLWTCLRPQHSRLNCPSNKERHQEPKNLDGWIKLLAVLLEHTVVKLRDIVIEKFTLWQEAMTLCKFWYKVCCRNQEVQGI